MREEVDRVQAELEWQEWVIARRRVDAVPAPDCGGTADTEDVADPRAAGGPPTSRDAAKPKSQVPVWREGLAWSVLSVDYQRILTVLADRARLHQGPLPCQELAVLFGLDAVPAKVEALRSKAKRLVALGTEAAMAGFRVKYVLATELVNELVEAADEKLLTKTIARYGRVDLLCTDELGYMELDRRGAELLFQVLTEREEKNSMAIASNESFSAGTKTFTDPRLCAAIVDRLTFGGNIIETGTDSYRLAHTKARAEQAQ
ncbi:ATP-binding protein [Streptomyces sp. NPDC050263]|uniref:ATP-binding protein n=1 Tax=Streptomyces sp. NPDC050263 TaxID=3155037 RepID=UPI00342461B6